VADLFAPPNRINNYPHPPLLYYFELWDALNKHAPKCMAYLHTHGAQAWNSRYGLPVEFLRCIRGTPYDIPPGESLEEYLKNPPIWEWEKQLPLIPDLARLWERFPAYEPHKMIRGNWERAATAWLNSYMEMVEDAYKKEGWRRVRIKYNPRHFVWLALKLEGLSHQEIAEKYDPTDDDTKLDDPTDDDYANTDTVRMAVTRLAKVLGIKVSAT